VPPRLASSSGTGRFTDASEFGGEELAITHTDTSPLAGTTDLTLHGIVAYDASNRAAN